MTNPMTPTSGAADLPEALRHAADVEHWARCDNGLRGTELRAAAATIRRLHALTAQAISKAPDHIAEVGNMVAQAISAEPAAHVQNPAENEHVACDVAKNGAEMNMSTQQQECGNTPYDEGPIALAQPVAPRGAADGFFLLLPQRPKPEAPAGTAGLDWDAYSGAQMLAFGRDCSDAAIAALRTQQPAPGQQGTAAPTVEQVEDEVSMSHGAWDLIDPKELIGAVLRLASPPAADTGATAEPYGWLYDWTHSSATGRPDTTYTGFTKYEAHARKHDNCIAVFTAPHPASQRKGSSHDHKEAS